MRRGPSGKVLKKSTSVRFKDCYKTKVKEVHGSVQEWIDKKLIEEFGIVQEVEVSFQPDPEIRPEDF